MPLFKPADRRFAEAVSSLAYANPFLPERIQFEQAALGRDFEDPGPVWSRQLEEDGQRPNVDRLRTRVEKLADRLRGQLADGAAATDAELMLYEDLVCYALYYRYWSNLPDALASVDAAPGRQRRADFWPQFLDDFQHYLNLPQHALPADYDPAHLFACFYQIRRAFHHIFDFIVGQSAPAARLRADVWQSVFTHDMRRYRRSLYLRMGDITTLVTGPSGTGKELVVRAVGLSRYIPFDPGSQQFGAEYSAMFHALNLSALSPTLIESELFGHRRGAFTGAVADQAGWLEQCGPLGTIFLDEIGELDPAIQVKLLRVLQTRAFQRLGETEQRRFDGKIIAATNRDLVIEMREGRFREDFYYRLCSDMIRTPSLQELITDSDEDLRNLILFIARRETDDEAEPLTDEVVQWIDEHLGRDYPWPGNIRELEQCVRNVMIRHRYTPPRCEAVSGANGAADRLAESLRQGSLTAEGLLRHYCTLVYAQTGSYEATAKRLKIDRRTVKSKVDQDLLDELRSK